MDESLVKQKPKIDPSQRNQGMFIPYQPVEIEGECILQHIRPVRFVTWRFVIFALLSVGLIGIPVLLTFWYPQLKRYFHYCFCNLEEATHFFIKNHDKSYSMVARLKSQFYETQANSIEIDSFEHRYLRYNVLPKLVTVGMFNYHDRIIRIIKSEKLQGLSEEKVDNLRAFYGPGTMVIKKPHILILLFRQVFRPLYLFLIFSCTLWMFEAYYYYTGILIATSAFAVGISLYQINSLNQKIYEMAYHQSDVYVLRDGQVKKKSSLELVPGDITFIKNPEKMPFDGVLLEGSALINQCALTGESVPIVKKASPLGSFGINKETDKSAYVYEGTQIVQVNNKKPLEKFEEFRQEYGLPVCVIRTNFKTTKGQLIRLISFPKERQNRFQKESAKFLIFLFCLSVISYLLLIIKLHKIVSARDLVVKFLDLITITVPPGLPISMTVGIVFALQKLQKKQIFCLSSEKVVVCGSVNFVCFDKTGTLTQDHMDFTSLIPSSNSSFQEPIDDATKKSSSITNIVASQPYLSQCLNNMACNHSVVKLETTGQLIGDPMETNLLEFAQFQFGDDMHSDPDISYSMKSSYSPNLHVFRRFQFDSDLQRMGVVARIQGQDVFRVYVKGSPEIMMKIMRPSSIPNNYTDMLRKYASMGLRVLSIASKSLEAVTKEEIKKLSRTEIENDIVFDGFEVFENKLKPETASAIQQLFNAEIPCVMITGDNALTGSNISYKCGIANPAKSMTIINVDSVGQLTQQEFLFDEMDSSDIATRERKSSIFKNQKMYDVELSELPHPADADQEMNESEERQSQMQEFMDKMADKAKLGNCQFCLTGSAFNRIFPGDIEELTQSEAKFFSQIRVFARAKPNDKARVIMVYQSLGKVTAMCGDGANDCGALKQADAGLSLSQAEASISSPFTSKIANISSMVELLKECRAGLATNFSLFNIMALYSLTGYTTTVISEYFYAYPSDFQYLYWDMACNFFFFIVIGYTGTAQVLCIERPSSSLFAISNLVSVLVMAFIQLLGQITIILALSGAFAGPLDYYNLGSESLNERKYIEGGTFLLHTPQTSALFLFSNFMYMYSMLAFSISRPWRKEFFTNIPLIIILVLVYAYSTMIVMVPATRISLFDLSDMDYLPFNGFVLGMANLFGIFMYINQKYILENVFLWLKRKYPDRKWI